MDHGLFPGTMPVFDQWDYMGYDISELTMPIPEMDVSNQVTT